MISNNGVNAFSLEQSIYLEDKKGFVEENKVFFKKGGFFWNLHEKSRDSHVKSGGTLEQYLNKKYEKLSDFFYGFFRFSNGLKVNGLENLDGLKDSGCVVVANHKSALDPFYASCALKDWGKKIRWISKIENFQGNDLFKIFLEIGGAIPLSCERKLTDYAHMRICEALGKNEGVGIFPEGTRNKSGDLAEFHSGAVRMCIENNVPYIPVALIGKTKPFCGKVTVNVGCPVYLDDVSLDYDSCKSASGDMRQRIVELLDFCL